MRTLLMISLVLFALVSPAAYSQTTLPPHPRKLIRVATGNWSAAQWRAAFTSSWDVVEVDPAQKYLVAIATPAEVESLHNAGTVFAVLYDNLEAREAQLRADDYFDHFHDYQRTLAEIQRAAADYPDLVQITDLGEAWEKTQGLADRDIWAVKISDHPELQEDEPEVLIIGQHHAREIITQEIVLDYMNYLLSNYGLDPYVTYLVEHRQIWLVPVLNPDGMDYVFYHDMWWRKNRRRNASGSFGVDLNRNYGFEWGYDNAGSSPSSSNETYRGTAAFSEPETAALRDFVAAHQFRVALSYHSFGNYVIYPWGYADGPTPDHASFVALADSIVAYNHYLPGTGLQTVGYPVNGDSDDWFYGEQAAKNKVFSMTLEVGNGTDFFNPDTTRIQPLILENRGPNLFITYAAGEEPVVEHHPLPDTAQTGGPYQVLAHITAPILLSPAAALALRNSFLFYSITGFAPFDSVALAATGNASEYVAEIPALAGGQQVYYFISAVDEMGRRGCAPRAALAGEWYSFYVPSRTTVYGQVAGTEVPQHFTLRGFPNPFRDHLTLQFDIPVEYAGALALEIFDVLGQRVQILVQKDFPAGRHQIVWNGASAQAQLAPAGVYFVRMHGREFIHTEKILLIR